MRVLGFGGADGIIADEDGIGEDEDGIGADNLIGAGVSAVGTN